MTWQLLMHAHTFARIETALKPYRSQLVPLIINDEAELKHPWGKTVADRAIAYGTQDAYSSPAALQFFQTLLGLEPLDWFQSSAAGTEHPVLQSVGRKAKYYTASHAQSEAIAEWVLWAGLDHFQQGPARRAAQARSEWARLSFRELSTTHWLILGFGHIGEASAARLKALGARVTGVRRRGGVSELADAVITPDQMPSLLSEVDAVLLCLPHTPETEKIANADFFSRLAPGSLFVNVGRGALVDEVALLAALDSKQVGHAALDVFETEPLPAESPFWGHPRVTLTAHIAAQSESAKIRTDAVFLENLENFLAERPLRHHIPMAAFATE